MLSLEGQLNTAYGAPMLSYTISSSPNLSSIFDPIADTVKANHIYMRIASTTFFTTTKNVVQGIIKGDYKTPEFAIRMDGWVRELILNLIQVRKEYMQQWCILVNVVENHSSDGEWKMINYA